jgi:RNA recognition motif-containing protein
MARYTLIQVFSKCGKVAKMDFLFHKTGPLKGKPRGYAFVEYSTKEVSNLVMGESSQTTG